MHAGAEAPRAAPFPFLAFPRGRARAYTVRGVRALIGRIEVAEQEAASGAVSTPRLAAMSLAALGVVFGDIGTSPLYTLKTVLDLTGAHPAARGDSRFAVADPLDALHHHDGQIRQFRHAHRQRRRGRHHRADDAARRQAPASAGDRRRGPVRRGADLRRRGDHAGDLGALRARRRGANRPVPADLRAAGCGRDPDRVVRVAAAGHGADRPRLRADHARLVPRHGGARHLRDRAAPVRSRCDQSALWPALSPLRRRWRGFLVLGGVFLCVTGAEALYADMGHFGPKRDPPGVEWRGLSKPHPQLRRSSGAGAGWRSDGWQHLLSPLSCAAADAADRARDDRDGHRQPVDHHRRLLDDAAGHRLGLAAAPRHQADVRGGLRPDLRRHCQLAADDRRRSR